MVLFFNFFIWGERYFIILAVEILHLLKLFEPSQCNTVLSTNNLFYYQFYMYINLHFMPSIMFNIHVYYLPIFFFFFVECNICFLCFIVYFWQFVIYLLILLFTNIRNLLWFIDLCIYLLIHTFDYSPFDFYKFAGKIS
jgi:hypothetical protein